MGGSQIWLEVGEKMSVEELLKAVIVASANDACTALGEYVAGSSTAFVKMMNDRAKELGLENTNFENCTGLDDDTVSHYSCAYDLAVIATQVMKHSIVKKYSTIWLDSLRNGETELNNTNKLVNSYDGITGLKTGTTSNAGFCVCATAMRDGMNLVAVVLGSDTSEKRFDTAGYLLDYGFANYEILNPNLDKSKLKAVKVVQGTVKSITPVVDGKTKLCIEKGSANISYKYSIKSQVNAPIKKGTKLGTVKIISDKKEIGSLTVVSNVDVNKISLNDIFVSLLVNI
jgi:D-alanyl-D-alanine carboxypeptidase (penicillin-binding protein 5/6)